MSFLYFVLFLGKQRGNGSEERIEGRKVSKFACVCYLLCPTLCPMELRWSMATEESEDFFAGNQAAALLVVNARRT